jgi:hypothetical protein
VSTSIVQAEYRAEFVLFFEVNRQGSPEVGDQASACCL